MSFGIIVRDSNRGKISKENKTEWRNEFRAKELQRRGYSKESISAMMYSKRNNIRERHVEKMLKHATKSGELVLNGNL